VDAGAVQTNYSIAFTAPVPVAVGPSIPFTAAVTLSESGSPFTLSPSVALSMSLTDSSTSDTPSVLTGGSSYTAADGVYTFSNLAVSGLSGTSPDTLTATLVLNNDFTGTTNPEAGVKRGTTLKASVRPMDDEGTLCVDYGLCLEKSIPLVVEPLDFTVAVVGTSSQSVIPGTSTTFQVEVTPDGGAFWGNVNFAVSGLPTGYSVTLSPSTIAAHKGATRITVTVATPLSGSTTTQANPDSGAGRRLIPLALALIVLFGAGRMRRTARRLRRTAAIALLIAGGAAALMLNGCNTNGKGFFDQAPTSYTVTVTATEKNTAITYTHSANVTLNVQ
jgi:hypothetical protein